MKQIYFKNYVSSLLKEFAFKFIVTPKREWTSLGGTAIPS